MAFAHDVAPANMEQMIILEESVEQRVSKLLLSLVKVEKENNSKLATKGKHSTKHKDMYRKVLEYKMASSRGNDQSNGKSDHDVSPPYRIFSLLKALHNLSK